MVVTVATEFWCLEASARVIKGTCSGFSANSFYATLNIQFFTSKTDLLDLRKYSKNILAREEKRKN